MGAPPLPSGTILRPLDRVVVSIGPEKQTIMRGFTLNPSNWFNSAVLLHTLGLDSGSQVSKLFGRSTRNPVCCCGSAVVRTFAGNGPTVGEVG